MIFCIETILMVFFWKIEVYSPEKFSPAHFGPFLVQIWTFFWVQHIFKACLWLWTWSEYSNCIHFLKALLMSFVMTLLSNVRTNVRAYVKKPKNDEGVLYLTRDEGYQVKYIWASQLCNFEYSKVMEMWEPYVNKAWNSE